MKRVLLFFIILSFYQCGDIYMDKEYPILFVNNTEHNIGGYLALRGKYGSVYPDTILPYRKDYIISKIYVYGSGVDWREILKKLPKDTLSIFIFHTDTLNKYSWEEVRDGYKILKRYDLSIQDLEKLDFNVPYPPSPEMSEMKMYPKYP